MGISAIVPKEYNKTRTNTRLYIRIDRIDYFVKWGIAKISIMGYATYESGLKMKLHEDYYKSLLDMTMETATQNFISKEDSQELIAESSTPLEVPYNTPQLMFERIYNCKFPSDLNISDSAAVYAYVYDLIKTDSIFTDVQDVFDDPALEEIETY
jgi:hypothetical protein